MQGGELERLVVEHAEMLRRRFYGKYRAIVDTVDDERKLGRIRAQVKAVYGDELSPWALPCVPFAGANHGVVWLPEPGDGVWFEFEGGDPSRPIWTGGWWGSGDLDDDLGKPLARTLITSAGHRIVIDDDNGSITIEHADGPKVELTGSSLTLECSAGKIVLDGSGVNVNDGALTVS